MGNYEFKANINWLKRKRDSLMKRMGKAEPFVSGSVVTVRKRCGNKNCKCAKRLCQDLSANSAPSLFLTH